MRKFTERINSHWHTEDLLEELLEEFFDGHDDNGEPISKFKTITHLYAYLNTDWVEVESYKTKSDRFRRLLETAELMCEEWVVEHGFSADRSFARYYLDRCHKKQVEAAQEEDSAPSIRIFIDERSNG